MLKKKNRMASRMHFFTSKVTFEIVFVKIIIP